MKKEVKIHVKVLIFFFSRPIFTNCAENLHKYEMLFNDGSYATRD